MSRLTIDHVAASDFTLSGLLQPDERLLWTGQPEHGLRFFQPIGSERIYLAAMSVGVLVLWASFPFIISGGAFHPVTVAVVFAFVTAGFALVAYLLAAQRQFVLSRLFYVVTDRRAVVCRRGRNWRLSDRIYIVANPHSAAYPYEIVPSRPYPTLRIGTLISQNEVQPTGFGLSHPGQPANWDYFKVPVAFEQISDADAVLEMIRAHTR